MAITATANTRKLVPPGTYFAAVVGIFDIGTQPSDKYEASNQIILSFELHKKKGVCLNDDEKPLLFNRYYSLKLGINKQTKQPSALRQAVEAILGRGLTADEAKAYDVTQMLDGVCRIVVAHDDGKDYIKSYAPLDDDDPKISPQTDGVVYELDASNPFPDVVPEWIQKTAMKSVEWTKAQGKANGKSAAAVDEDEIPY